MDSSDSGKNFAKYDEPPNSRLFIVCGKSITEEDFRNSFDRFGHIEEVWVLKDRVTQEPKGVTYIKFSKTSEAALAMEEMNGKCIGMHPRPIKVLIAHSRDQGSHREINEEERLMRLFVIVPKSMQEHELKEHFSQFGDIDYISIVKDRNTRESKGFAYVKYHRMSHAAKAYEGCDKMFKAVFADPKPQKSSTFYPGGDKYGGGGGGGPGSTSSGVSASYDGVMSFMDTSQSNPDGNCRLVVVASPSLNQDQLWRLFDIVPGLDFCDMRRDGKSRHQSRGLATVVYNNSQSATYAKEKLHGFEYPPGQRMIVKFDAMGYDGNAPFLPSNSLPPQRQGPTMVPPPGQNNYQSNQQAQFMNQVMVGAMSCAMSNPRPLQQGQQQPNGAIRGGVPRPMPNMSSDLATLAETIAKATSLIQAAGFQAPGAPLGQPLLPEVTDPSYCSVKLPPPRPLAPKDAEVEERLFVVCASTPPPAYILKDVFGRFGNLIDIYMLNRKTCGYAKYASKESADRALETLHSQDICGIRLKVMTADPQDKGDTARKRLKIAE